MKDLALILHRASRISHLDFSASRSRPRSVLRSRLGAARGEPLREFARHALDHQRGAGLHHPGEPAGNLDLRIDGNDRRARCLPRNAAGTSTRSLISITMWTAGKSEGQIFTYDIRSARMLKILLRAERSKGERRVFQQPVESLTPLRRLPLRILDSPDANLSRLSTGFG